MTDPRNGLEWRPGEYGVEELWGAGKVLGSVTMCRGRIVGRVGGLLGKEVAWDFYYNEHGTALPERYRRVQRVVEARAIAK
jgi:hypothetical protein